jgi:hypothetical protein
VAPEQILRGAPLGRIDRGWWTPPAAPEARHLGRLARVVLRLAAMARPPSEGMAEDKLFGEIDEAWCEYTDVPDRIARHNGQIIGVEHTSLYWEDPAITSGRQLQPQEIIHWGIVGRASEIFHVHSNRLLWLYVTFDEARGNKWGARASPCGTQARDAERRQPGQRRADSNQE